MEKPFEFILPSSNFKGWVNHIKSLTGAAKRGKTLKIAHEAINGKMVGESIQPGLDFLQVEVIPKIDLVYQRDQNDLAGYFTIMISIERSPFIVLSEDKEIKFDIESHSKIILLSPTANIKIKVEANSNYTFLVIFLDKNWVTQNLIDQSSKKDIEYLKELDKPAILYKNLGSTYKDQIQRILSGKKESKLGRLSAFITLISDLFTEFRKKETAFKLKVKQKDSEAIIAVCRQIDEDISRMPSLDSLAKSAGMSLSKFKYTFKYITGMTPYQYHLKYKLNMAKDMLLNSNMTVSEVGYLCGYTNLSHFARVFRSMHGVLPGKLKK